MRKNKLMKQAGQSLKKMIFYKSIISRTYLDYIRTGMAETFCFILAGYFKVKTTCKVIRKKNLLKIRPEIKMKFIYLNNAPLQRALLRLQYFH